MMYLYLLPVLLSAASNGQSSLADATVSNTDFTQSEILVIGEKMKNWRGRTTFRNGVRRCKTERTTGDKEVDAIGCSSMLTCQPLVFARYKKESSGGIITILKEDERAYSTDMGKCVWAAREQEIDRLIKFRQDSRDRLNRNDGESRLSVRQD